MIFKDYYKILGLEDNNVTVDEIKVAYREQAKKYHPDVNIGNKSAEERFKDINEAYTVLSNENSKKRYDRIWISRIAKARQTKNKEKKKPVAEEVLNILFGAKEEKEQKQEKVRNKKIPIRL